MLRPTLTADCCWRRSFSASSAEASDAILSASAESSPAPPAEDFLLRASASAASASAACLALSLPECGEAHERPKMRQDQSNKQQQWTEGHQGIDSAPPPGGGPRT